MADLVVSLGSNGRVASQGSVPEALSKDPVLTADVEEVDRIMQKEEEVVDADDKTPGEKAKPSGKLVQKEEVAEGRINWGHCESKVLFNVNGSGAHVTYAVKWFFGSFGGMGFWMSYFLVTGLSEVVLTLQTWWLGLWARQYDTHEASEVNVAWYLGGYGICICICMVLFDIGRIFYVLGWARGSRKIHKVLLQSVLAKNLRWLDSTPVGRIISRFTQDMQAADGGWI